MLWDELPLVRRDMALFRSTCNGDPASYRAVKSLRRSASLSRVLVLDGRCTCAGINGIGNLFGDYVVWFTVAALTNRAVFFDWTDSAATEESRIYHYNSSRCRETGVGVQCHRVPLRFDLGAYFSGVGGSYRWSRQARAAVVAKHGSAAEHLLVARTPNTSPASCDYIIKLLQGETAWVTLRVAEDTAVGMMPFCTLSSSGKHKVTLWPDAASSARLVSDFIGSLEVGLAPSTFHLTFHFALHFLLHTSS